MSAQLPRNRLSLFPLCCILQTSHSFDDTRSPILCPRSTPQIRTADPRDPICKNRRNRILEHSTSRIEAIKMKSTTVCARPPRRPCLCIQTTTLATCTRPYVRRNETAAAAGPLYYLDCGHHQCPIPSLRVLPPSQTAPANAGNSTGPVTVTEVIDLTTTVCPRRRRYFHLQLCCRRPTAAVSSLELPMFSLPPMTVPLRPPAPSSDAGLTVYPHRHHR